VQKENLKSRNLKIKVTFEVAFFSNTVNRVVAVYRKAPLNIVQCCLQVQDMCNESHQIQLVPLVEVTKNIHDTVIMPHDMK